MNGITLRSTFWHAAFCFALITTCLSGCMQQSVKMPHSRAQLQDYFAQDPEKFTIEQINQANLSRVLSNDLNASDRLSSLSVLVHLNGCTARAMAELSLALDNPATPASVRSAIVGVLARNDQAGIEEFVLDELSKDNDPRIRNSLLDWITRHPSEQMLDDIVILWANSNPADSQTENRFRRTVETISLRTWPDAMLEAINKDSFKARTSALKILQGRMSIDKLIKRIVSIKPKSKAMEALNYYAFEMNTLPSAGSFYSAVVAYVSKRDSLSSVAATVKFWSQQDSYTFSPSDIHLLEYVGSRWGSNVFARDAITAKLIILITERTSAENAVRIESLLSKLDTADIYRAMLLIELFEDSETSRKLRVVAQRDAADKKSRWGGLISGYDGGVGASLYPPAMNNSDYQYIPSERFAHDAANSICWFVCHFEPNGMSIDRPEGGELQLSEKLALPGVIISAVSEDHYSVVLFTSEQLVVPLGTYQFSM